MVSECSRPLSPFINAAPLLMISAGDRVVPGAAQHVRAVESNTEPAVNVGLNLPGGPAWLETCPGVRVDSSMSGAHQSQKAGVNTGPD